jgi:vibriolysin
MNRLRLPLSSLSLIAVAFGCVESSDPFVPDDAASLARAEALAIDHLRAAPVASVGEDGLRVKSVFVDDFGGAHVRVQQFAGGVPVLGGEAIVHLDSTGAVAGMKDRLVRGVDDSARPAVGRDAALATAIAAVGGAATLSAPATIDLVVNRLGPGGGAALTWRVQLEQMGDGVEPALPVVFVDAKDGSIHSRYDNLKHAALRDADKETWDMKRTTKVSNAVIAQDTDAVALAAHTHAGLSLAYFLNNHNRDSFNGLGAVVKNYVHYGRAYVNAFWNGSVLTYGDGDGTTSGPLVTLDIVAHELSHGVTDFTADLVYANESGALNEATSDIFAAAIEAAEADATSSSIWLIGEDCWNAAPGHLRNMANPTETGDYDFYASRYTGTSDNGGVHWNSGIANLFFHLLAVGGQHPRASEPAIPDVVVPAIGIDRAAALWYRALTQSFTAGETFTDAREDTVAIAAATDPDAVAAVNAAWDAVGVPLPPTFTVSSTSSPFNLSRRQGRTFSFTLPTDGSANLAAARFTLAGSNGDADLYVKFNASASTSQFDCKSTSPNSNESCTITGKGAGTYNVYVYAYSAFSNVTLKVETAQ